MNNYDLTKLSYENNSETFLEHWKYTNGIGNDKIKTFIQLIPKNTKILSIGQDSAKI